MENKVELLSHFGDDLMAVNSARVSFGKSKDMLDEKDERLIKYLVEHKHTAPFRHPQLQFRITCPIYVERQLFKHQVGLCLAGDSYVTFIKSSGGLRKIMIKDLYEKWNNGRSHQLTEKDKLYQQSRIKGMKLRILNEDTHQFEIGGIKDVMYSGKKEVYKITCQDGNSIKCSKDHRIYTKEGWKSINNGLSTKDFIGLNGLKYVGTGEYQVYENLKNKRELGLSIEQMSKIYNCSYPTIRKWLKIHGLQFSKDETYFKQGSIPWNKNKKGYKLNYTEKGYIKKIEIANNQLKGSSSPLWRGGITNERGKIGQWTRSTAKKIHTKYNFTCQECGNGGKLHCHHIIPVTTDISKAYDIDNLITLCQICHQNIHKSALNEITFAEKVTGKDFTPMIKDFGKNTKNRKGNKLKVHFSKIISIEKIGIEDTYDIEVDNKYHNFVANGIVVHNSANSISGRYVDFSDSYTTIKEWRKQSKDSKQGSDGLIQSQLSAAYIERCVIDQCKKAYEELLKLGVSKEQARTVLPLNLNTTFIWTGSLLAFIHLWNLRLKPDAQQETREVADQMLEAVKNIEGNPFKWTLKAFGY
jgi:thymidylate synthase (FAD)